MAEKIVFTQTDGLNFLAQTGQEAYQLLGDYSLSTLQGIKAMVKRIGENGYVTKEQVKEALQKLETKQMEVCHRIQNELDPEFINEGLIWLEEMTKKEDDSEILQAKEYTEDYWKTVINMV